MNQAKTLKNAYMNWLKEELIYEDVGYDYISISTPFIDSNYDNINLYAKFIDKDKIEISDFGYTVYNLEETGITLNRRSKTIYNIFKKTLTSFGVTYSNDVLKIVTDLSHFPIAKNRLLQAILRINDLIYLNKNTVTSSFNDILSELFIDKEILYTPDIEIVGPNGTSSHFDFSVPLPAGKERLIKTSARPNDINQAKIFNFDVRETALVRESSFTLVLNDEKTKIKNDVKNHALLGLDKSLVNIISYRSLRDNPYLIKTA